VWGALSRVVQLRSTSRMFERSSLGLELLVIRRIVIGNLLVISSYIDKMLWNSLALSTTEVFIYARVQALFKALFFPGDRAADMLQVKVSDILCFPDNSGFLFNHIWTNL